MIALLRVRWDFLATVGTSSHGCSREVKSGISGRVRAGRQIEGKFNRHPLLPSNASEASLAVRFGNEFDCREYKFSLVFHPEYRAVEPAESACPGAVSY